MPAAPPDDAVPDAPDAPDALDAPGVDPSAWSALLARAQRDVDERLLPSCQLALARDGEVIAQAALGEATLDSRYVIFSATKPIVASGVWALMGDGQLDAERTVASYLPEFATNGKDVVTVAQVLLHTSGFPRAPFGPADWDDAAARRRRFERWRLNWEPGTQFEYHPTSAHWVLAALIERVTGDDFRRFLRARVLDPLGLDRIELGVPCEHQGDVRDLVLSGAPATRDELRAALGIDELPVTEVTPDALMTFNDRAVRAVGVPGGGAVSTAAELARFYQALLHGDQRVWQPAVLADATENVRNTYPDIMGVPANRTFGVVVAGDDGRSFMRGMGRTVTARAFGHNGAAGQIAWADPATGVSFCFLTDGIDQHQLREWRRTSAIASRAGVCVPA